MTVQRSDDSSIKTLLFCSGQASKTYRRGERYFPERGNLAHLRALKLEPSSSLDHLMAKSKNPLQKENVRMEIREKQVRSQSFTYITYINNK
jgi:hypothetical protein